MDAFDNPARNGMAGPQREGAPTDQANDAMAGNEFLAAAAGVTATASAIPLAIQAILVPDASGRIVLPAGVSIDDITVSGADLLITLPNGQVLIVPGGAVDIPSIVVDGDTVPASTVAQLLENLDELNPEAGIRSSGGNFADPEGAIQDPYALGDLLPYTELAFPQPENREIIPAIPEEEDPTVVIVTPDQPAGSVDATASVNEAGLPARGSEPAGSNSAANVETVTGSILIDTPDGAGSVTINGTAITAVGQVITTPIGQLTITSIAAGNVGYSYTLTDNTNANNNVTDVFAVVVTDIDGDTATADLTISIIDDVPTARADTDAVAAGTFTPETGNVLSGAGTTSGGTGADTQGADGASLSGIRAGATGTEFAAPGAAIQGQYGTLTIDAQGNYSYVRSAGTPGGVSDVFTYRLTDGDGDTSTATLTISIADSSTTITSILAENVVEESQLAARSGETPGSAFDGDGETTTGAMGFIARDGVGSVTINGVAITPGALPQTIFSDATGTLTINAYVYDPATGNGSIVYTYTLNDNTLDANGTVVPFNIVVTDSDGDSSNGILRIQIIDDVPTAVNDVDSVTEDSGIGENPPIADGNVLTGSGGSDANGTDGSADVQGADGATVTAVTGGTVGQAFAAAFGTLTLNANGSYTYVLNNDAQPVQGLSAGETLTEVFTYTLTDGDGDTSTATLTITINGADDGVTINGLNVEGGELVVDEDDLIDGSSPDDAALTPSGSFTVSTPDGLGNVTIGGVQVVTNGVFTAGTATSPLGVVNITGFTPEIGADGSVIGGTFTYEYVLSDNTLTHVAQGQDDVTDSFAVVVTDSDGTPGNASLDIRIIDDVPTAANDADSVTEDSGNGDNPPTADGNVLTGTGGTDANTTDGTKDVQGADGATVTAVTGGTVGEGFPTAYGTLTLNADGSYTYVLNNQAQPVQGLSAGETLTETFTYTITDGDGDTSPATLTITINGANDGVTINGLGAEGSELSVDEDDLPAREGEAAGSDTTPDGVTDGDSFTVSTPDGMGTVVLDSFNGVPLGAPLTLVVANGSFTPQSVATAYGRLDITGFTPVTGADGSVIGGTFTYTYTLTDNRTDHPSQGEDNRIDSVGVTVTDVDGSTASANIDIRITDDVPTAVDDGVTQSLENQPVTINVLGNDVQGADSVQPSAVELVDGSLTGAGTLVYNNDGSFTYTPAAQEVGEVSFQYLITDGDGDTSTATATIILTNDSAPQFRNPANVVVDEDGLPGANADNGLAGEVTSTGLSTADGSITVDFGSDVPATLAGSLVLNDSAALDTQLTVNNVAVTFAKVGNDLVGSVAGNEVIRIALTTPTAGPGATQVTYGYTVTLSQAIDQAIAGSEDTDILSGIGFTVTDNDGTTASGAFGVTIVDDLPTLSVSDAPTSVVEGATANGTWALDAGADGVTSVNVSFGAGNATLSLAPGSSVSITQPTGTLTVNADGTFSFAAAGNQNNNANPSATFTLSAVDRDGDPTSDSLTIKVTDGAAPANATPITLTVNEAALVDGSNPASPAEVASGNLSFTAGSDALSGFAFTGVAGLVANLDGAGTDIYWTMAAGGQSIVGSLTPGGAAAITISLTPPAGNSIAPGATASATVTVTLADNLPHALAMAAQTQALGTVTVQATDTDGDPATGTVTVQVIDDIPAISANAAAANALTVDDSDLSANATANFGFGQPGSLFNVAFNADGPAAANSIVYALGVKTTGAVSGIIDTATGQTVLLTNEAGVIVGRTSGSGEVVFTLTVDANGTVTLDQQRAVFHTPDTGPDQTTGLSAADLITLTATATDSDGDPVTATANIGGALTFKDDGVSIDISVIGESDIVLRTQDADTIGAATDTDVSTANFGGAFSAINADFGEDGAGSISWNYALSLFGADGSNSTLTSQGASIFLYNVGGVITGSTAASAGAINPGNTIFTLGVNAANGTVTLNQMAQIDHANDSATSNFDNQISNLANNLVKLTGTVTIVDKDGDTDSATQSIDLGGNVRFADDGPTISNVAGGASVILDETNGFDTIVSATPVITANFAYGADGAATTGAVTYGIELTGGGTSVASGLVTAVGDFAITLVETSATTIVGRYTDGGGTHDAFTISIGTDGKLTVTQLVALEHLQDGELALHNDALTLNGLVSATVTIKDGDGDTATGKTEIGDQITFLDDGPTANADAKSVTEGALVTGNVLTDNADAFGSDGPATTLPAGGVVGVRVAGVDTTTPVTTGTGTTISTALGDLTLNADGTYSYDAKPNTTSTVVTDTFVYTIRDADGDTSTTTLTITIQPVTLVADNQTKTVNEAGLDLVADGNDVAAGTVTGSNPAATTETATGTLAVAGATGYVPQTIDDTLGKFVLNANGTYTYTLKSAFDGATLDNGVTTENAVRVFNYTATDANGNLVNGTVTINIIDDVPTAQPDTDTVTGGGGSTATGNVITDMAAGDAGDSDTGADTRGADGAAVSAIASVNVGANTDNSPDGLGNFQVNGQYGALTINTDGSYTYIRNAGTPGGVSDTFRYTLTDGDGDTATTTLTISIGDSTPVVGANTTVLLDDDALTGGNPNGIGDDVNSANTPGTLSGSGGDGALTFALLATGTPPAGFTYELSGGNLLVKQGATTVLTVTLTNPATGAYTVTQNAPIVHAAGGDENNQLFTINYSVTDIDGDGANGTLSIDVDDDTPTVVANAIQPTLTVDESNFAGNANTSFASVFTTSFGADGAATANATTYALGINPGATGLVDTATGQAVVLMLNGGIVEGRTAISNALVFTVSVAANGTVTLDQSRAVVHTPNAGPDDTTSLSADNLVTLTATVTDRDGDSATATANIGQNLVFTDDAPTVTATAAGAAIALNDETATTSQASTINTGAIAKGDDPNVGGTGAISVASSGSAVVTATPVYGADGAAAVNPLTYALTVTNAASGLTVTDGSAINLVLQGNVIVGQVSGGAFNNQAAFAIAIDPVTGVVRVEQYLSLNHPVTTNPDDTVSLLAGRLGVVVTATDRDGDPAVSNTVDISAQIRFDDDGPTVNPDTDTVTEDTASIATGNVVTGVGTTNSPGSADVAGADGAAVTGVVAGTSAVAVTGGIGAPLAGTYGSLTLNADGGYTYTLNNGNATVQALGVNETLTEIYSYTITDGDGDTATTTLTITINGSNDLPTIGSATTAVSDEGLAGGFPDTTGSVDTTNLTVRTGTITATDPDGDPLTFSLGTPATALSSGGQPIVWDTTNPQLLLGKVGADTIISVAIDNGGNFTVSLLGPIDHPNTTLEDALSLVVPVNVNDGTTTVTNASALTIGLEDDSPIAIAPLNAQLVNAPGSSVYQSLDTDGDVDNNYGGDGPGSVIFTAATVAALQAQNLTSGSQALNYVISANGTVLTAEKPNGDDVFIIRLQPAGHPDQYQVQMVQKLDSTVTVDFNDGGYNFVGGNTAWIGFVKPGDNDSSDILITPMTNGIDGGTMNANATNTGVSGGNSVGANEAVRVDFVVDLTGSPGNNDYGPLANQNHAFDSHYTANGASALFSNIQTSSSVRLVARDDIDTDNDVGDGVLDTINKVAISFNNATLFVTANGTYNVGGQNYTVTFSGGQVTVTGVTTDTRLSGFTADGYNSIEFHHAGGDTFKIGDFGAAVQTENPVNFNVPVTIVDGDGDTAQGSLAITTAAPLLVIGSANGDVSGQTTDHVVANPQGQVDGVIQGSNFDDTLVGDPGSVTITEGQQANVVLVLDSSGSMTTQISFGGGTISRMQALKNGVNALIDSLSQSGAQDVRVTIVDFDNSGTNLGTFDLVVNGVAQAAAVTAAKAAVNGMSASGGTNYEDGLQDALAWINGNNGIPGADVNKVVFVSDGNPTLWNSGGDGSEDSTNVQNAMNQILGGDGSNEPQQILATGYSIDAIGVNVNGTLLTRLSDVEDGNASGGTGAASNATSAEQLASILQNLGGTTDLAAAGNDVVNGGDGADVIFGDVLFTDALATQLGVSLPAGSGWAVFQTLEGRPNAETLDPAGNGANWNRQDTIAYIRANYAALAQESGRTGGNDTINTGAGNDIVFGQEGNDTIDGGAGDDLISGGTGSDILTGGIGNDIFWLANGEFGATESINGGADNDTILLTNATTVNFSANTISAVETLTGSSGADTVTMSAAQWAAFNAINLAGDSDTLNIMVSGTVNISAASTTAVSNVEAGNVTGSGGADTLTLTGAQLDAIIQANGTIDFAGGSDTIALTSTSTDLNGLSDARLVNVETVSAAGASAGVTINLGNQTEAMTITGSASGDAITASTGTGTVINAGAGADTVTINAAALTSRNWTVDLGNADGAADKIVFNHDGVGVGNDTVVTVSSFNVAQDKIAIAVGGTSETDGGFVTVTANQTTIGAGVEIVELVNASWVTTSLGNDGDGSTIEGFIQAATDGIPAGTYTFIVYSNTTGTANAGVYSVTISDSTNPGNSGMVVEHVMTINGVGYGNLSAANFVGAADPIILDLNGDGYSFGATALFDIDADGAADRVTWNSSNDGILAVDLDGNGTIDSGTEIFTPGFGGGKFANGTEALASLDDNGDGVIDANDAAFAKLLVWQDANADGVSDAGELSGLADQGITSISTGAASVDETIDGQAVTARGSFTRADGNKGDYIEVQLDAQLGARGADRETEDAQRSSGNQALTASLVAASLVAMAQGAQAQPDTDAKPVAEDLPTVAPVEGDTAPRVSVAPTDTASTIGTEQHSAAKEASPADNQASHLDDASPAAASIDSASDSDWRSGDNQDAADTADSDALFDMASTQAASPMDGLLTLGLAAAEQAAAAAADTAVKGAAAEAVLAELHKDGGLDHLIDAVVGTESQHAANDDAPAIDLTQFLSSSVPGDMGAMVHQSIEQDLHQMAAQA